MVNAAKILIKCVLILGDTALHIAFRNKDVELAQKLLKHNANPFLKNAKGVNCIELAESWSDMPPKLKELLQQKV